MLGLSISGMVLHSFTDRMIVYPFMLVGAIIYYLYRREPATEREGVAVKVKVKNKKKRR